MWERAGEGRESKETRAASQYLHPCVLVKVLFHPYVYKYCQVLGCVLAPLVFSELASNVTCVDLGQLGIP